jgi:hypothetical protein
MALAASMLVTQAAQAILGVCAQRTEWGFVDRISMAVAAATTTTFL